MAYKELIKNFNRIRDYMRDFYVYGFKSRDEYTNKSARSYDDEHRRIKSWLDDYMKFDWTPEGKHVFLSIDTRLTRHNPLYNAWKAKSFTDGDITIHFILMDILSSPDKEVPFGELVETVNRYVGEIGAFDIDASTLRKKLKEYVEEGIIESRKQGKVVYYRRVESAKLPDAKLLDFFSEVAPCGVIGSFLLDKVKNECFVDLREERPYKDCFAFKHHYITSALDSDILCQIFDAMRKKQAVTLTVLNRKNGRETKNPVIPLRVMISVQNGRQYLMGYVPRFDTISPYRIDNILSVEAEEECDCFDELRAKLDSMMAHIWGVSTQNKSENRMEHVEFTVRYRSDEVFIPQRLEREKRCGTVKHLDAHTSRFAADVYDTRELIPWIRTFICRITDIQFSNKTLEEQFKNDLRQMYELYGLNGQSNHNDYNDHNEQKGGEKHAI